jgi:hypothetical protein
MCPGRSERFSSSLVIEAQSVPSAAFVPCIAELPPDLTMERFEPIDGATRMSIFHDRTGPGAVEIEFTADCKVRGVREPAPEPGVRKFVSFPPPGDTFVHEYLVFDGGCVHERIRFQGPAAAQLATEVDVALALWPRARLQEAVQRAGFELDP